MKRPDPSDTELLDMIQHFVMWPGPATVEIYENHHNQVVVKSGGGRPKVGPVVKKDLRSALAEWYCQICEKDPDMLQRERP